MKQILSSIIFIASALSSQGQGLARFADSIRVKHEIPELAYAVVSADSVLTENVLGFHRADLQTTGTKARPSDYFHLGSNTKAITGFIAAYLVENKKITWSTKLVSLFPDWKKDMNPAYYEITLQDLMSHRARIKPYTSGEEFQSLPKFAGSVAECRQQFVKYLVDHEPLEKNEEVYNYSNAGYSVAAVMLEKVSGKTWEELVDDMLAKKLKLSYKLGWPNKTDPDQPFGHWIEDGKLTPLHGSTAYNLNLAEPAGDISMPLGDYVRFIQLNLQGLKGKANVLKPETYHQLHFGLDKYAIGWLNVNGTGKNLSEHAGSAGTFYTYTLINKDKNLAYIIMANCATEPGLQGVFKLLEKLIRTTE